MTHSYSPGLKVTAQTRYRCRRTLPIAGDVLVQVGQVVTAQHVVASTEMPGDATPINLARRLGIAPNLLPAQMLAPVGAPLQINQPLAKSTGWFGFGAETLLAPVAGVLESVSNITGQALIRGPSHRLEVLAHLPGTVIEVLPNTGVVIEGAVALIQGIFGVGGEAYGELALVGHGPETPLTADRLTPAHRGRIVVGGARLTGEAVAKAQQLGVAALIAGGIDDADLKTILGYDLGVAITGLEQLGLTLIVTEGFGDIPMARRTYELLTQLQGQHASVNGATQIRAGVQRPEILVAATAASSGAAVSDRVVAGTLELGATVRIIREPAFGRLGAISALPAEPQQLGSGALARVLRVRFPSGEELTVPRANVELVVE